MKFRNSKHWNPINDSIALTKKEIESQAESDFLRYNKSYHTRYQKSVSWPLDIDAVISELWGYGIVYEALPQSSEAEEVLGLLDMTSRKVIIDRGRCGSEAVVSLTLAHEAGHLSLHAPMVSSNASLGCVSFSGRNTERAAKSHVRREWQAYKYAGAILAPRYEVVRFLEKENLFENNVFKTPLDMTVHAASLQGLFGMSRHALEVRLCDLDVPLSNRKYAIERQEKPPLRAAFPDA